MRTVLSLIVILLLTACSGPKYTVDDGRRVNEALLAQIRNYGAGERALRPAIERTAALKDPDCDKQWELPFSVATSYGWDENDRVAWVRGLGVDERLTVVAVSTRSTLKVGDRITRIGSVANDDSESLLELLGYARDQGGSFEVTLADGKSRRIVAPFEVCRGYTRLAPPNTPALQDYHWLLTLHPLEVPAVGLDADEALWMVLWTQGLSEEGGARMKVYDYGMKFVGTLYNVATIATGLRGAAMAAETAIDAARSAAASAATEVLKQQVISEGQQYATDKIRQSMVDAGQQVGKGQAVSAMQKASANRGNLWGVSRIAATVFDRADAWAFERMDKLGGQPLAGFTLHQKLVEAQAGSNALLFDADRLVALSHLAATRGMQDQVTAILGGVDPDQLLAEIGSMPLASAHVAFSYSDPNDPAGLGSGPFARGLVDAMLRMPTESKR
ncbi:MAG: hypothetical protein JO369_06145 [Paucibacter sp.]|nr:hypothetical protein [Roseateles sp.]